MTISSPQSSVGSFGKDDSSFVPIGDSSFVPIGDKAAAGNVDCILAPLEPAAAVS